MKGLFKLLRRYIPPFRKWIFLNIIFNLLGAIFGAFSFLALSPILGILFGTQSMVTEQVPFSLNFDAIKSNLFYVISNVIERDGHMKALFYIGR